MKATSETVERWRADADERERRIQKAQQIPRKWPGNPKFITKAQRCLCNACRDKAETYD